MSWWDAIILGFVEGLTEYLPVSSTGHLILSQRALGVPETAAANAYAICIQAGAILAVLGLYRKHVTQIGAGWFGKVGLGSGNDKGFRLGLNIIVAFLPAAFFGLLFDDWIEQKLFGLWPIVAAWFVGHVARNLSKPCDDRWRRLGRIASGSCRRVLVFAGRFNSVRGNRVQGSGSGPHHD